MVSDSNGVIWRKFKYNQYSTEYLQFTDTHIHTRTTNAVALCTWGVLLKY